MKKTTFFLCFIICMMQGFSQSLSWANQFNGPAGDESNSSIAIDPAGNVYSTGLFNSPTDFDPGPGTYTMIGQGTGACYVSKLDASGNFIWAKELGTGSDDLLPLSNTVDNYGNIYITGYYKGTGDFDPGPATYNMTSGSLNDDIFISKLDSSGSFVWAKSMGGANNDAGIYITVDNSGNVYTTGYFLGGPVDLDPGPAIYNVNHSGGYDFFVSKLDASGNFVWANGIGSTGFDKCPALKVDINGNVYLSGYFSGTVDFDPGPPVFNQVSDGGRDIFISKLDSSGNFLWARQMGGNLSDGAESIFLNANGEIYITGYFQDTVDFDPGPGAYNLVSAGSYDIFICKMDNSANIVWAKKMGSSVLDYGMSIIAHMDKIYIMGVFKDTVDFDPGPGTFNLLSAGLDDVFILTLDTSGNFVSGISMGGLDSEYVLGSGFNMAIDGSLYLTGTIFNTADFDPGPNIYNLIPSGGSDAFIVKYSNIATDIAEFKYGADNIKIYPNPTSGEIHLEKSNGKIEAIEMYTSLGEKVNWQWNYNGTVLLDVGTLRTGIYFLLVNTSTGMERVTIIKQ